MSAYRKYFLLSLIILLLCLPIWTKADGLGDWFGASENTGGSCSSKSEETIPDAEYAHLIEIGNQFSDKKDYCKAVQYYSVARTTSLNSSEVTAAWVKVLESYFYQYDYDHFFDEAFSFFDMRKYSEKTEYVHYLVLKAVTELAKNNAVSENPYLLYALGVSPEQFNQESSKQILKYRSYLDKYPNSENAPEVLGWLNELKVYFNKDYANKVRELFRMREYVPAITRFQFLLNQGPTNADFTMYAYECATLLHEFAYNVVNESIVSNVSLARWMITTEDKVDRTMREQIQLKLYDQSNILVKNLIEKFPDDAWSKRALQDFGRPH